MNMEMIVNVWQAHLKLRSRISDSCDILNRPPTRVRAILSKPMVESVLLNISSIIPACPYSGPYSSHSLSSSEGTKFHFSQSCVSGRLIHMKDISTSAGRIYWFREGVCFLCDSRRSHGLDVRFLVSYSGCKVSSDL